MKHFLMKNGNFFFSRTWTASKMVINDQVPAKIWNNFNFKEKIIGFESYLLDGFGEGNPE